MLQWKRNESAFTLIELLVVVIIVAILAGVGVPLLAGNVQRARLSEADAGLGTIKTGMRSFFAENRTYVGTTLQNIGLNVDAVGNNNGDLDGRFFDDNDYVIQAAGTTTFCARVTGSGAGATEAFRAADVTGLSRSMNEVGTLFNTADCT